MTQRLIHFNCARPIGEFSLENEFVKVFMSILPSVFDNADAYDGLHWHNHGVRKPCGEWANLTDLSAIFPYPQTERAPDICTMGGWASFEALKAWVYDGKTHAIGMKRLTNELDRTDGASFVMWWADRTDRFTLEDGFQRLEMLRKNGPSDAVFDLASITAAPSAS